MTLLKVHTRVPIYVLLGAAFGVAVVAAIARAWGPRLVINATRSEPMGLYRLRPQEAGAYRRGMRVVFPVPPAFLEMVYGRGWLRPGVPLLKTIVALAGDEVCIREEHFEVNGRTLGPVYAVDSTGASMPRIRGCFAIPMGFFFPAGTYHPRSFDGRYIGPQPLSALRGEAQPLWTF
jgi:conjugative transfer signal peptidase TraF